MAYIRALTTPGENITEKVKASGLKLKAIAARLDMNPSLLNHHLKQSRDPFAGRLAEKLRQFSRELAILADSIDLQRKI